MRLAQLMVVQFRARLGLGIGDTMAVRNPEMHARLLREETEETCAALAAGDLVEVADGLADVIYIALGCAIECGINLSSVFAEVHRSNLAKEGGPIREDGKRLKPPGWQPPDVAGVLTRQGWDGK